MSWAASAAPLSSPQQWRHSSRGETLPYLPTLCPALPGLPGPQDPQLWEQLWVELCSLGAHQSIHSVGDSSLAFRTTGVAYWLSVYLEAWAHS